MIKRKLNSNTPVFNIAAIFRSMQQDLMKVEFKYIGFNTEAIFIDLIFKFKSYLFP